MDNTIQNNPNVFSNNAELRAWLIEHIKGLGMSVRNLAPAGLYQYVPFLAARRELIRALSSINPGTTAVDYRSLLLNPATNSQLEWVRQRVSATLTTVQQFHQQVEDKARAQKPTQLRSGSLRMSHEDIATQLKNIKRSTSANTLRDLKRVAQQVQTQKLLSEFEAALESLGKFKAAQGLVEKAEQFMAWESATYSDLRKHLHTMQDTLAQLEGARMAFIANARKRAVAMPRVNGKFAKAS